MLVAELVRAIVVQESHPQRPVNPIPATAYLNAVASGGFTVRCVCDSGTTTGTCFASFVLPLAQTTSHRCALTISLRMTLTMLMLQWDARHV